MTQAALVGAQGLIELFGGMQSNHVVTAGVSVYQIGIETLGIRESGAWLRETDSQKSGGEARLGLVLASPVTGGLRIRPYVGADIGLVKRQDASAFALFRPSAGVQIPASASFAYVVEAAFVMNRGHADGWALTAGLAIKP